MQRHPDFDEFERRGAIFQGATMFCEDAWKGSDHGFQMAMDAAPALQTTPNTGIPAWLTMIVDPEVYKVIFAPNKAVDILGEKKRGTWLDDTAIFPYSEYTGEVSNYGDYSN